MAASVADKAARRAAAFQAVIRDALAAGDSHAALTEAVRRLRAEAAKIRRQRPADGALTDAALAGSISVIAAQIHAHRPRRPAGCPPFPRPDDLTAAFDAAVAVALGEEARHER